MDNLSSLPTISVILPGWNENSHAIHCIASLRRQTYAHFNVYMILGGEDTTYIDRVKKIDWKRLIVLEQVVPNKMKAYNSVLDHPELGDILVFSDVDCVFPDTFLARYAKAFRDPQQTVVTGRVCPTPSSQSLVDRYHRNFEKIIAPSTDRPIRSIVGSNFAVRKNLLINRFGRFEETIPIGTDHAIAKRLQAIGAAIHFTPAIVVYTDYFRAGCRQYMQQQARWVRIRVLGNWNSNPKAFRSGLLALLAPWCLCVFLPLTIVLTKGPLADQFIWVWRAMVGVWLGAMTKAWLTRYRILRHKHGSRVRDLLGAWQIVALQFGIQMLAGMQIVSKKQRFRW